MLTRFNLSRAEISKFSTWTPIFKELSCSHTNRLTTSKRSTISWQPMCLPTRTQMSRREIGVTSSDQQGRCRSTIECPLPCPQAFTTQTNASLMTEKLQNWHYLRPVHLTWQLRISSEYLGDSRVLKIEDLAKKREKSMVILIAIWTGTSLSHASKITKRTCNWIQLDSWLAGQLDPHL